jgi:hypothetical protein
MARTNIPVRDGILPRARLNRPMLQPDFGGREYRAGFWLGYLAGVCWGGLLVGIVWAVVR